MSEAPPPHVRVPSPEETESDVLLGGAIVQRVDVAPAIVVLRVRAPGVTAFLVVAAGRGGGVGITRSRPLRGGVFAATPESEKLRVRGRIEGARIVQMTASSIVVEREGTQHAVAIDEGGARVLIRPVNADDLATPEIVEAQRTELEERGLGIVAAFVGAHHSLRREELARAFSRAITRVERRAAAIRGDYVAIEAAQARAVTASLFVAEAARAARGAPSLRASDWSSGEERVVEFPLDPSRGAREQLDAVFRRARRLKLGAAIVGRRLAEAEAVRVSLIDLAAELADVAHAPVDPEAAAKIMDAIAARARAAAPRDIAIGSSRPLGSIKRRETQAPRLPFRTFIGRGDARIFVGRGGEDNDALTFHRAKPHDLWLHAKGWTGAHVIVPLEKSHSCPAELLIDAAHLAAHFSDAREELVVEVQTTPRRFLQKPRGSAPGKVVVRREKVVVLRVNRERLAALLAGEVI